MTIQQWYLKLVHKAHSNDPVFDVLKDWQKDQDRLRDALMEISNSYLTPKAIRINILVLLAEDTVPANPNAGIKQAFPKGRW